jgi:hypothetical protein
MKDRKKRGNWEYVDGGSAFIIPYTLLRHPKMTTVSPHVFKLIFDMGKQYAGNNNGYLLACWERMSEHGWRSRETLALAVAEAEHHKLIVKTRQGGRNRPNRYALTWWPIDWRSDDPLDGQKPVVRESSNAWKEETSPFVIPAKIQERRRRKPRAAPLLVTMHRSTLGGQPQMRKAA